MKKIIITGATSMIGIALTEVAIREGTEVYAIIRPDTKRHDRIIKSPLVHTVFIDLEDLAELRELPGKCDVFYHLAWLGTQKTERDDPEIQNKNIQYTLDAVKLAGRCGCKRFIGAGSQAEYGPVDGVIDDTTKFNPVSAYGVAKYAAGILSRKLCEKKGIRYVWGRVFSVYGPHDNEGTMLNYAIECFNKGEVAKFSSGTQLWNYLYESDAGEMFYKLGKKDITTHTCFIAYQESIKLMDYIAILMRVYGHSAKAVFGISQSYGISVNMNISMNMLSYKPQISFEEGIRRVILLKNYDSKNTDI